ncbi:hypothetical protein FHR99_003248 [Litorivivens lipolytica]|uniref:Uncharacterized protein n=1 Tax=Litorivivens lipolytica TaxID=1524264 RepID=A0A7W4W8T1_9GAMM|nr:hypothetical protein [Litorivivens lipolytica]
MNWDCKARIECLLEEASQNAVGQYIVPDGAPTTYGLSSPEAFSKELRAHGWVPMKTKRRQYRAVFGKANQSRVAYIFIRKNGIDIEMIRSNDIEELKPYSFHQRSSDIEKAVAHYLAHTTFNLFEGLLRFSESFINNESDLDRYFEAQGSKDKRNEMLRRQGQVRDAERRRLKAERDYYDPDDHGDYPEDMYLGYHID